MLYLTMNQIKSHNPCTSGWTNLLKKAKENGLSYPKDADIPISMNTLLDWCPIQDVIWAFRCNWSEGKELYVKFARNCAKRAETYAAANANAYVAAAAADAAASADVAAYAAYADAASAHAANAAAYADAAANAAAASVDAANAANAANAATYAATYAANAAGVAGVANAATYAATYAASAADRGERSYQKAHLKTLLRHHKG